MKRLVILLGLLLVFLPAWGGEKVGAEAAESGWILAFGGAVGSEPDERFPVGGGYYLSLETPAVADNWTLVMSYNDLNTKFGTVGTRYWGAVEDHWLWLGFGVGTAKLDLDREDYAPGGYVQAGFAHEFTPHLGIEIMGEIGSYRASYVDAAGWWEKCRYRCEPTQQDSWETVPSLKAGLTIAF